MRLVIGHGLFVYKPIAECIVACEDAIGAFEASCDEVHHASQRAAAAPRRVSWVTDDR